MDERLFQNGVGGKKSGALGKGEAPRNKSRLMAVPASDACLIRVQDWKDCAASEGDLAQITLLMASCLFKRSGLAND
ncbi:hypothetical protein AVEN_246588-1 [Araneus ventricosus]|uniref:Uncharacterized protein n=1 Tax=Araneus ventricosus TaxID=182803 RepID=A0A4Y2DEY3_ARAVE|nr:hypothetical protein AVEN_246588-1 [Araneus ventricosus]